MSTWTTLCRTTHVHEARMIASVLQGSGFQTRLKDHQTIGMNSFYSHAIGGVKVDVQEEQAAEAAAFLKRFASQEDIHIDWEESPTHKSEKHDEHIRSILRRLLFQIK